MTDITEIKRDLETLTAKVAAYEASKARNWPEKIEAGMRKEDAKNGDLFRSYGRIVLIPPSYPNTYAIALTGESVGCQCYGWGDDPKLEYLGHARDILAIRTDAHEPTGAELVGKRVNCFDTLGRYQFEGDCDEYNPNVTYPYRIGYGWYSKARLAR